MSKTRHTPNLDYLHVPSIDNIEMQAGQFRELSAEELEMVSGGFSWGDLLGLVPRAAPTILSLL
jgi:phosphoribosylformylglycinamidine (FGAM) synthase-like amidotransferase family enzyme